MTDRYAELVKAAYEAQQAREGDGYKSLTGQLNSIDGRLASLAQERETTVAALEAMDDAVEAAKEALDAYFAGREEDDHPLTRDHMYEHDEDELGPKQSLMVPGEPSWGDMDPIESDDDLFEGVAALPTDEDEYASAKANGALS